MDKNKWKQVICNNKWAAIFLHKQRFENTQILEESRTVMEQATSYKLQATTKINMGKQHKSQSSQLRPMLIPGLSTQPSWVQFMS